MVAGEAETSEMALYRQKANKGDHRSGIESRTAGGGQRAHYRVMCKMVAWIPRQQCKQKGAGSITLHTSLDSFWCAEVEGSQAGWVLHADHVRRLQHAHQRNRKRLMTDLKDGKRHSARSRRGLSERLANCSEKYGRRIQSFCHEATAHFAKFALEIPRRLSRDDIAEEQVLHFGGYPPHLHPVLHAKDQRQG